MMPMCECGTQLELETSYSGADWNSEAGDGSGYTWELSLACPKCGKVYVLGYLKDSANISPVAHEQ